MIKIVTQRYLLFILFMLGGVLFYLNFQQREYGWDMPGYLGSYYQTQTASETEILRDTYRAIKNEASIEQYSKIVGNYKQENWKDFISKNPNAFVLQIPYYSIKVFYVSLIYCFIKVGFPPALAVLLPNLLAFFIFGFILFFVFKEVFSGNLRLSFILTALVLFLPHFRYMATIPSPDMLVVLLMTWYIYVFLKNYGEWIKILILVLIVATRPDMIIFAGSCLFFQLLYELWRTKKINVSLFAGCFILLSVYLIILQVNNYPGWHDVFYDTFIERRRFVTGNATFTMQQYLDIMFANLVNFKKITMLTLSLLLVTFLCTRELFIRIFAVLLQINLYLKFLFFPAAGESRFFIVFALLLFILTLKVLNERFNLSDKLAFNRKI